MNDAVFLFIAIGCLAFPAVLFLALFAFVLRPWLRCFLSGAPVSVGHIVMMRLRRTPVKMIVDAYLLLHHAGLTISLEDVERIWLEHSNQVGTSEELADLIRRESNRGY